MTKLPIKKEKSFPIVAIGASAGGLEAISLLLKNLPPDTGMAFIYVQHLNPDHKSSLPSILSRITKMEVQEIEDMEHMKPNNVYVIPHNKIIKVTDGHIKLLPRPKNSSFISIDVLFSSLAVTHKENTIGIILSGHANDGKIGLKAIKEAGGITFAQDGSAQVSSMPKSAIASGAVDFILSPKQIALKIASISKTGFLKKNVKKNQEKKIVENKLSDLDTIFEILLKENGVDFNQYKMPTIKRRLNNRMVHQGVKTQKDYLKLLLKNKKEIKLLYKDLLINVTDFFRDTETFKYLKTTLLPKIINNKTPLETIRIWVPACSTGQEAYSIAILISELQENKIKKIPVQIFATDLAEHAIQEARTGIYSQSNMKSVSKKQLENFFIKTGHNYQISKEIREMCIFAPHNILSDPPFSRMDFISCRNLLIYFNSSTQKKVFNTLHFALNDGGYLLLGSAETIGTPSPLFSTVDTKFKVYSRKKNAVKRKTIELSSFFPKINSNPKKALSIPKNINGNPAALESAIDSFLLSDYMPACVVVNKDMEVLQFRGPISLYLTHPSGKASLNILKITRPEFIFELRRAITTVLKTKQKVIKKGIELKTGALTQIVSLEVSPLKIDWDETLLLIVFKLQEQVEKFIDTTPGKNNNSKLKDRRIKNLLEELNVARAEMKIVFETQESTYQELQAANEEIVSSNEEFQTLNEELETSKEEIQASNEELLSSNSELQIRNDLLKESKEYSEAVITTIHEPMLVLHEDFSVKSANKSYYKKFAANEKETEKISFFELDNKQWNTPTLKKLLKDVLTKNSSFENFEVKYIFPGKGEKIMLLNAHSIIQKVNSEKLILLAIADVTEVRKLALELLKKENAQELSIANKKLAFQIIEKEKHAAELIIANKELIFQNKEKEKRAAELILANKELAFQNKEKEKRAAELIIANKELAFQNKEKEKRAAELIIANKELAFQNKEKEKRTAELVNAKYARSLIEASLDPLVTISANGKITDVNEASIKATGIERENLIGTNFSEYFTDSKKAQLGYQQVFKKGFVADYPLTIKHKNGKLTDVLYNASLYKDDENNVIGVFAAARDVTEQKRIETELLEAIVFAELATKFAEDEKIKAENATRIAEDVMKSKQQFLANMSHEIRTPMNAIIGFTKIVLKTELSEKQKEYLSAIQVSGDNLIVLINDILDLAKVDSGKMTFEKSPFNLRSSISSMLHLFESKIQEQNLVFVKEYDNKIPEILIGDSARLHQIILNLISNAIKFTSRGKISVSVNLIRETKDSVTIEFSVSDTGIGIQENDLESIFENFQQATRRTASLYGGTGLGLAIVKQLVEAQGGSIHVKSKIDEGSTFRFRLNFQKTKIRAALNSDKLELNREIKNIKVLVVEDVALNQLLVKTLLEDFGFEYDIASNGKIAIEKLQTKSYDIILMDLQMPEMNGFEATEYIRNTLKYKVPIIALTADVTTVDIEKCKAIGMDDYVTKPIDEKLLYTKIIELVSKSSKSE
ncbi:MAG: CheR family methyltransferase [Bacteroidota bacterium]|nr:CheR family methyltransferase [Bacteroidota bacterium]